MFKRAWRSESIGFDSDRLDMQVKIKNKKKFFFSPQKKPFIFLQEGLFQKSFFISRTSKKLSFSKNLSSFLKNFLPFFLGPNKTFYIFQKYSLSTFPFFLESTKAFYLARKSFLFFSHDEQKCFSFPKNIFLFPKNFPRQFY